MTCTPPTPGMTSWSLKPDLHLDAQRAVGQRELDRARQRLILRVGGDERAVAVVDQRAHLHELDDALVGADHQQVQPLELDGVVGSGGVVDGDVGLVRRLVLAAGTADRLG